MDIQRLNPMPRWSDATVYRGLVHFVAVAADATADMQGQITQVLKQAEQTLAGVNSDKSRLLSVTIYITDFAHAATLNAVWEQWLPTGCAPSRACVKVELADPAYLVEIAFVAAVND